MIKGSRLVYGSLLAVWVLVVAWQVVEHDRVHTAAQTALLNRSLDITTTVGLVIRSQRRFRGMVSQERLESAIRELLNSRELSSVALYNAAGEIVAAAGSTNELTGLGISQPGVRWGHGTVTVVNLVDLGTSDFDEGEPDRPTIVMPRRDPADGPTNAPPLRGPPPFFDGRPPRPPEERGDSNRIDRGFGDRDGPGRRRYGRPFWMDENEFQALLAKRGLHGMGLTMSTDAVDRECREDFWLRFVIGGLGGISVLGLGLAWRNLTKSSELQIRLLRASELNSHLREVNVAAAGLAHETRNPLNIIRGLAQIISRQDDASTEVRKKSRDIIDETDRVTAQLNEFINYSRPREVRFGPVDLDQVIGEVARALAGDVEEKHIQLALPTDTPAVRADEPMLRQVIFNLMLNAIQAVDMAGSIQITADRDKAEDVVLEVRDDGPGVAPEHRAEVFKPYFTTHQKGTGLGLAVVHHIVTAHGWEIECLPNEPRGALFRIRHVKTVPRNDTHGA